ncbi:MAG: hypothetical protein ABIQ75_01030 [Flavobacteriales bacterium]
MKDTKTSGRRGMGPKHIGFLLVLATFLFFSPSCKHEPLVAPGDPAGTGNTGGGGDDPIGNCDPNTVYFEQQILPLLISNCAVPGCHNVATNDNHDIQITSYTTLMQSGIVQDGDLWDAITDNDPDDIMPRPPQAPLTPAQIALIGQWIQQGAQNNSCVSACDTSNVTYSGTIAPMVQARCQGCHSGATPQGGLNFTSWQVLNGVAMDGRLAGAIQHQYPFASMPPSGPILPQCRIDQFLIWINAGAPQN